MSDHNNNNNNQTKSKYKSVIAVWIKQGEFGEFLSLKFEEDFSIKAGENLNISLNNRKKETQNEKAPDYVKLRKLTEEEMSQNGDETTAKPVKDEELPF